MTSELVNRFNERDEVAFRLMFEALYPQMVKYACALIKDWHEAEDVSIIVFNKMYWSDIQFKEYPAIKGYLLEAVKNESINYLKSVRRRYREVIEILDDEITENADPEPWLFEKLKECVNQLPDQYKRLLSLSLKGYTNKEICELTDMKRNTIDIQKHRAIKILKSLLNK